MTKVATTVQLVVEGDATHDELVAAVHESLEAWGRARTPFAYFHGPAFDQNVPVFLVAFDPAADGQENF